MCETADSWHVNPVIGIDQPTAVWTVSARYYRPLASALRTCLPQTAPLRFWVFIKIFL